MVGGSRGIDYAPEGLGTNCAVAAALALWEWHVVQPAALTPEAAPQADGTLVYAAPEAPQYSLGFEAS